MNDEKYQPKTYYYTDAISDNAVTFCRIREGVAEQAGVSLCVLHRRIGRSCLAGRYRALQGRVRWRLSKDSRRAVCTAERAGVDSQGPEAVAAIR